VKCNDCGATWDENYKLAGITSLVVDGAPMFVPGTVHIEYEDGMEYQYPDRVTAQTDILSNQAMGNEVHDAYEIGEDGAEHPLSCDWDVKLLTVDPQ
jgi:hypothetical protein